MKDFYEDPFVPPDELAAANARHDREHGGSKEFAQSRIRSSWNEGRLVGRGPLTDKKIARYAKAGWFSLEFRQARRDFQARKQARRAKREGNFDVIDGRFIYRP